MNLIITGLFAPHQKNELKLFMTDEEKKAAEANALATAQEEARKKKEEDDKKNLPTESELKILSLEKEKEEILVREANYKIAYLKEKKKNEVFDPNETDDERIRRITREELANTRLAQIDTEKEALLQKTIKENKELKLVIQNKIPDKPSGGGHNEHIEVQSTSVTPEQLAAFKAKGWSDKDIERYKKNLQRYKS
jgi:hypothetical protein